MGFEMNQPLNILGDASHNRNSHVQLDGQEPRNGWTQQGLRASLPDASLQKVLEQCQFTAQGWLFFGICVSS